MRSLNTTQTLTLRPFTVAVPDEALTDLKRRLDGTRFAATAPSTADNTATDATDWAAGTPVSYLQDMVQRWRDFDWRAVEARINSRPNFRTELDGQTIHVQHIRSPHPEATPLLLAHTYPGSFLEFEDVIEPLTDPTAHGGRAEDAFHLVIPSMPGIGFSTPLTDGDWTTARVARAWDTLMRGLGYDAYAVHGSDVGALVGRELAILDPEGFRGAHVLQLFSFPSGDPDEFAGLTPRGLRRPGLRPVVHHRQRLRVDERLAARHHRGRAQRLPGRPAGTHPSG